MFCICGKTPYPDRGAARYAVSCHHRDFKGPKKYVYKCREAPGRVWHIGTPAAVKYEYALSGGK